ncbi:MAG: hypothetical protein HY074_14005 [Deltaproteobacteria bacterium]|nr:hypothetical protein [Deltaproteobacteria bacterium]
MAHLIQVGIACFLAATNALALESPQGKILDKLDEATLENAKARLQQLDGDLPHLRKMRQAIWSLTDVLPNGTSEATAAQILSVPCLTDRLTVSLHGFYDELLDEAKLLSERTASDTIDKFRAAAHPKYLKGAFDDEPIYLGALDRIKEACAKLVKNDATAYEVEQIKTSSQILRDLLGELDTAIEHQVWRQKDLQAVVAKLAAGQKADPAPAKTPSAPDSSGCSAPAPTWLSDGARPALALSSVAGPSVLIRNKLAVSTDPARATFVDGQRTGDTFPMDGDERNVDSGPKSYYGYGCFFTFQKVPAVVDPGTLLKVVKIDQFDVKMVDNVFAHNVHKIGVVLTFNDPAVYSLECGFRRTHDDTLKDRMRFWRFRKLWALIRPKPARPMRRPSENRSEGLPVSSSAIRGAREARR